MTEKQLVELVLEVSGKTEDELPPFRILALGKIARNRLADLLAVAKDQPFAQALRQLLRKDFSVTITDGVGNLAAVKAEAEPLIAEQIPSAEVYFSGIPRRGQYVPDRSALNLDRTPGFPFFTITGDTIEVRYNGDAPDCTATIRGAAVRSLANIPPSLDEKFAMLVAFLTTDAGAAAMQVKGAATAEG